MSAHGLNCSTTNCHRDGEGTDGPVWSQSFNASECLLPLCFVTSVLPGGFHPSNRGIWWVWLLPGIDQHSFEKLTICQGVRFPKRQLVFFLWDVIHFLFSSNAFPSIFNRVCWKLVNQESWMRSLRNICAWHNCIKSNNQRRNYSTREVKWGVARRLFIFPM